VRDCATEAHFASNPNRLRLALEPERLENPTTTAANIASMVRIRSETPNCLWFQMLGVEAHPSLPGHQNNGGNLPRKG
jgi:hypothetical protein